MEENMSASVMTKVLSGFIGGVLAGAGLVVLLIDIFVLTHTWWTC